ncbi:hypothetical protein E0Z10_g393 [Xylaria hypoxylon]|uniref:Uncharacterized protein n=1 Tax=Xylaria hypoxylon TaxID=37992 RepID=A0A4Z0ZBI1_9PEZI|nr:hypothetical protein E0Z10_g393 [Xylaria hypoxylon]
MTDAMKAELFHEGTPYGRQEFDKWFADYDVIIEMPFFMLRSTLKAYPDAQFILTERDPEKWAKSYLNTIGVASTRFNQFPMSVFKHFDSFTSNMGTFGGQMVSYCTNGFGVSDKGHQALVENYKTYIADVKRLVPPERLEVFKLEDGFGWNELCPSIGMPIPNTPWPSLNTPEEFHSIIGPKIQKAVSKGMAGVTTIIAIAAIGFEPNAMFYHLIRHLSRLFVIIDWEPNCGQENGDEGDESNSRDGAITILNDGDGGVAARVLKPIEGAVVAMDIEL